MRIEDVAKKASAYIKLADGETVKVRFSDSFQEVITNEYGVKYECKCEVFYTHGTEAKKWSGSANFYSMLAKKATAINANFSDTVYSITRKGTGTDTLYEVEALPMVGNTEVPF